jgi:hypothetical protein
VILGPIEHRHREFAADREGVDLHPDPIGRLLREQ